MKTPRPTKNAERGAPTKRQFTDITGLLALHSTINEALLRAWRASPSRWCRATFRTGAEYTLEVAGNLPDSEVFSRPKFSNAVLRRLFGFGRDALVRKAGGMATSMYSTSRHPLRRLNNGALGSESQVGAKTMCPSPMASRSAAPTTTAPTRFDPIALHGEAVNACAMARWYAARHDHSAAARKATQAMVALRRLAAFDRLETAA